MTQDRLIEFLDKSAALARMPREDRVRAAVADLRDLWDALPALLGVAAVGLSYPNDDGLPWGRIDPETRVWEALDKTLMLVQGLGPPPFYWTAPTGRLIHVVHEP